MPQRHKRHISFRLVFFILSFFNLGEGLAYEPGSIKDKYDWYTIDGGDFCYSYWMDTYFKSLWKSEALVRQSVVPSAMVDANGDLFTMSLCSLSSSSGALFNLQKFSGSGKAIVQKQSTHIYPWTLIGTNINVSAWPNNLDGDRRKWFDRYASNAFQACIAQDVSEACNALSMMWYVPPTRHMNVEQNEGLLYQVRLKDNLSTVAWSEVYQAPTMDYNVYNQYAFHHLKTRNYDASRCAFISETGNFSAASKIYSNDMNNCYTQVFYCGLAADANDNAGRIFNLGVDCVGSNYNISGLKVYQRYIKWGNRCYGMCSIDGNRYFRTFSFSVAEGFTPHQNFTVEQKWHSAFGYIDHANKSSLAHVPAYEYFTPYNYDFCIVKGNDGIGILCMLGLRSTGLSADKTLLTGTYNSAWNYINWGSQDICLMLSSCQIGSQPEGCYEDPQNMIYTTGKTSETTCNIGCGCYATFYSDYGANQLFKNTHKCCVYAANSGRQYIIYCYCYPGKKKQLYLGYAPITIDANNKVHLMTKCEFKSPDTSENWGDSFGEFTSCARIISMDCKKGHLWITWLNATDSSYECFHMQAKDLVGE